MSVKIDRTAGAWGDAIVFQHSAFSPEREGCFSFFFPQYYRITTRFSEMCFFFCGKYLVSRERGREREREPFDDYIYHCYDSHNPRAISAAALLRQTTCSIKVEPKKLFPTILGSSSMLPWGGGTMSFKRGVGCAATPVCSPETKRAILQK